MSAYFEYSADPGAVAGHTIYRKVSQREVKEYVQVGTHVVKDDIGQAYPRCIVEPVFEERTVLHVTVTWITVPNNKVAAYEASYGP